MKAVLFNIFIINLCLLCVYITNTLCVDLSILLTMLTRVKNYLKGKVSHNRAEIAGDAKKHRLLKSLTYCGHHEKEMVRSQFFTAGACQRLFLKSEK